ncbi:hypothetical protein Tco_0229766, partial [Tanacetum coccineum]
MGFNVVVPPPTQVYSPPQKDLSWIGLPKFFDNTITDYTRPTPSVDTSNGDCSELAGKNTSMFEQGGTSSNVRRMPLIQFVKGTNCPSVTKINSNKNARTPTARYAELYRKTHKFLGILMPQSLKTGNLKL